MTIGRKALSTKRMAQRISRKTRKNKGSLKRTLRKGGKKIDASEATRIINKENALVVDLRTSVEFNSGTIAGAINLEPDSVDKDNSLFKANQRDHIVLVCKLGSSSSAVGGRLIKQGFENVNILSGGMQGWVQAGLPLIKQ